MLRSFYLLLLLILPGVAWANPTPALYICAHPDDCFLFMNPNIYDDIADPAQKTIIVYLTSGDAGLPYSEESSARSYPYVRELASIDTTEWIADAGKNPITAQQETQMVTIHDHSIERVSYANTASYFLRLPDGNFDGNGFENYAHESLRKLKNGEISSITPIDNQASYTGWDDLVAVVSDIIAREAEGEPNVTLHIQDPDMKANTHDHSDHTTGAESVMDALAQGIKDAPGEHCYTLYKHIDYSIAEKTPNLDGMSLQNKAGSFAVLTATQRHYLDHDDWEAGHLDYVPRNYFTTTTLPEGCTKPH